MGLNIIPTTKSAFLYKLKCKKRTIFFKTLGIETTEALVSRTINKMNGIDKERQDPNIFVQHLSIKSIKMKLNRLLIQIIKTKSETNLNKSTMNT